MLNDNDPRWRWATGCPTPSLCGGGGGGGGGTVKVGSPRSPQRGGWSGRKVEHREPEGLMDLLGGVILLFVEKK